MVKLCKLIIHEIKNASKDFSMETDPRGPWLETLATFGKLLVAIPILWCFVAAAVVVFPARKFFKSIRDKRNKAGDILPPGS